MASYVLQPDGSKCYAGSTCKRHGSFNRVSLLKNKINSLFEKTKEKQSLVSERPSYSSFTENNIATNDEEHLLSLALYVDKSHYQINSRLRREDVKGNTLRQVASIDYVIEKFSVPTNFPLYRGVDHLFKDLKVGDKYVEKAYMSTSSEIGTAFQFARGANAVLFRINAKSGAPINKHEFEYLLGRNKNFLVTKISKKVYFPDRDISVSIIDIEEI